MNLLNVSIREYQLQWAFFGLFVVMLLISITVLRRKGPAKTEEKRSGWDGAIAIQYMGHRDGEYTRFIAGSHQISHRSEIQSITLPGASLAQIAIIEKCRLVQTTFPLDTVICPYIMVLVDALVPGLKYEFPYGISRPDGSDDDVWTLHIHIRDASGLREFYLSFAMIDTKAHH